MAAFQDIKGKAVRITDLFQREGHHVNRGHSLQCQDICEAQQDTWYIRRLLTDNEYQQA
jgi:hypothetical protein